MLSIQNIVVTYPCVKLWIAITKVILRMPESARCGRAAVLPVLLQIAAPRPRRRPEAGGVRAVQAGEEGKTDGNSRTAPTS